MSAILYPFHPATGLRLVQTVELVPAMCPRNIYKEEGEIRLEDASGSSIDWDAQETQAVAGDIYLADEDGNQCLASEVKWSDVDAESIEIETPGPNSCPEMANFLRDQLLEIASAAREVILDSEQDVDCTNSCKSLKALLIQHGLWEEFTPEHG